MEFNDVEQWCCEHSIEARAITRGSDFAIKHDSEGKHSSAPSLDQVYHWELIVDGRKCPTSTSDMERLVTGKMALEEFTNRVRSYYSADRA